LRTDKKNAVAFLDTTFLLPFFQVDIEIEAFSLERFKKFLRDLTEVHFSELSIYEAKAKLRRLSRKEKNYTLALDTFGASLAVLLGDGKFIFHPYTKEDDDYFNLISEKSPELDSFDMIILAQAYGVGFFVTEDEKILSLRSQKVITSDPVLGRIDIRRWKELKL
jgi:predicted nucleic acid-binding protein